MAELDVLDRARLHEIGQLQHRHRERTLTADELSGLVALVSVLLRRYAGSDAGAQAAINALLALADAGDSTSPPTIATIIRAAAEGPQAQREMLIAGQTDNAQ